MPSLTEAYQAFIQMAEAKSQRKPFASNLTLLEAARNCQKQLSGEAPLVWTRCTLPQELIAAFGAVPVFAEMVCTVIGVLRMAPEFLLETETLGFSTDSCTVVRTPLGAILSDEAFPPPALMIGITDYCEDGMRFFEHLSRRHPDRECLLVEVPYRYTEEAVDYVEGQLKNVVAALARATGTPYDPDRLRELIRCSNRVREVRLQINDLKKSVPARLSGRRDTDFFGQLNMGVCGQRAVELTEQFYQELLSQASEGARSPERTRLMWLYALPPVPRVIETLDAEWGARVVAAEEGTVYWDEMEEREPLRAIARKICQSRTAGPIENRLGHILRTAREHSVQGAIHFSHFSCAYSTGGTRPIKDALAEQGVAFLNLDGDCAVAQQNNVLQMLETLEEFVERLVG